MQLASRVERDRARAGSSLVAADFEGSFFFFLCFRKKLRARATRNKENNNSGLISEPNEACLGHGTKTPVSGTRQLISWVIRPLSEHSWSDLEAAVALP